MQQKTEESASVQKRAPLSFLLSWYLLLFIGAFTRPPWSFCFEFIYISTAKRPNLLILPWKSLFSLFFLFCYSNTPAFSWIVFFSLLFSSSCHESSQPFFVWSLSLLVVIIICWQIFRWKVVIWLVFSCAKELWWACFLCCVHDCFLYWFWSVHENPFFLFNFLQNPCFWISSCTF